VGKIAEIIRAPRSASTRACVCGAAALVLGLAFGTVAEGAAPEVPGADQIVTRTLPNGMKVVVWRMDVPLLTLNGRLLAQGFVLVNGLLGDCSVRPGEECLHGGQQFC
jgi:hypothetical protein